MLPIKTAWFQLKLFAFNYKCLLPIKTACFQLKLLAFN